MKQFIIILMLTLMVGCTAIERIGDYVSENELIVTIAARQAVGRYIAAGGTLEEETRRAKAVESRLTKINEYLDGNPMATTDDIIEVVESNIDWASLEAHDKMLVGDIIAILKKELEKREYETGIKESSLIAIRALFDTAISAARIYLMR